MFITDLQTSGRNRRGQGRRGQGGRRRSRSRSDSRSRSRSPQHDNGKRATWRLEQRQVHRLEYALLEMAASRTPNTVHWHNYFQGPNSGHTFNEGRLFSV